VYLPRPRGWVCALCVKLFYRWLNSKPGQCCSVCIYRSSCRWNSVTVTFRRRTLTMQGPWRFGNTNNKRSPARPGSLLWFLLHCTLLWLNDFLLALCDATSHQVCLSTACLLCKLLSYRVTSTRTDRQSGPGIVQCLELKAFVAARDVGFREAIHELAFAVSVIAL